MRNYAKVGGKTGAPGYRISSSFRSKVLDVVKNIPKGKTLTYEKIAELSGKPGAKRAVGNILRANQNKDIPFYRIVRNDGWVGGYHKGKMVEKKISQEEKLRTAGETPGGVV